MKKWLKSLLNTFLISFLMVGMRLFIQHRCSCQWGSPLHMVQKKDGSWRPCGYFCRLNLATKADKYPVPNLADFSSQLEGCTVFSTLDLKNGYLQVPLEQSAMPKTAVITPFGLFEFLRMTFQQGWAPVLFKRTQCSCVLSRSL